MSGSARNFNCSWELCGKSFYRNSDLCRHFRIHTNERPYQCTVKDCNKGFIQRSALTVHLRVHTGEKPHACDHDGCQRAFSDSSSLARHRRVHTGMRPYICPEPTCERSFCRKTTLTRHQNRSHPSVSLTRPSLEDAAFEHPYQHPAPATTSTSDAHDQYLLAQQLSYPISATPSHEFYSPQNVPTGQISGHASVHESALMETQNIPVISPMNVTHVQHLQHPHEPTHPHHAQRYMQMIQLQYNSSQHTNYVSPKYHQQPFLGHQTPSTKPVIVRHQSNFRYNALSQV